MNVLLDNVNLGSNSGPNYFAQKLTKYLDMRGVIFDNRFKYDICLCFIQSNRVGYDIPMVQRLDGIYFNANFDCDRMNQNIKRTYDMSNGAIFQTEFNKDLIFKWFGPHDNYTVINNGADIMKINNTKPTAFIKRFENFDNIWSCASEWHVFKRLKDNVKYFLEFSKPNDCLVVAGKNPNYAVEHPRVFYVGNLDMPDLISLYKVSKYFLHLAYLDHCPNVVLSARACGCQIICSSSGGTKEIAGSNAIVIKETREWDLEFIKEKTPPILDLNRQVKIGTDSDLSMTKIAKKYDNFLKENL